MRATKTHMAVPTAATIKKLLEGIIVPEMQAVKDRLTSIEGEIKTLHVEIKRLDDKIDNGLARLDNKIETGLAQLDNKIETGLAQLDNKIGTGLGRLEDKIDNGLARLEERIAHLDDKLTFTNKRLDEALEIRERLAALEAKVGH